VFTSTSTKQYASLVSSYPQHGCSSGNKKAAASSIPPPTLTSWHDQSISVLQNSLRVETGGGQMAPNAFQKLSRTLGYLHFSSLRLAFMWAGQKPE